MHISAHMDVDVVAVETEDEVSVLVELTAPEAAPPDPNTVRHARTLQVVLDRSGSMAGDRLQGAINALLALVDRLEPTDNFGVVTFDHTVELAVPAGPLTDKPAVKRAIASIVDGGSTDLSAGYLRGIQEARRVVGAAGGTLLLISDGHANAGVTDPDALGAIGTKARRHGIVTTTLGWGLGYDERLMSAIARGGSGNELFAENSDQAVKLIAGEIEGLLSQTAQAASMLIRLSKHVSRVAVINELPTTATADGVVAELGSFYAGETRKVLLTFTVPALAALGLTEVATLDLTYVELPSLKQHIVTMPLHVNVVPGDVAAGRIPDVTVRTEVVYQRAQQAKRRASRHLSVGDTAAAMIDLRLAQDLIAQQRRFDLPEGAAADLAEEAQALQYLAQQAEHGAAPMAAKYASMDASYKSRHRGRTRPRNVPEGDSDSADSSRANPTVQ
ncbi:MAG TPA: VWA domain-containing protein [Micromonosporaceae bacterium]|nr:VWA domain-containing protein [Micromonosporaceae bacterium]